jgi:peptide-methionine (S)-S-oxide reductase
VKHDKTLLPNSEQALIGRDVAISVSPNHLVLGTEVHPPWHTSFEVAMFGLGCFWGAERRFWQTSGVHVTSVGYAAGVTPNPSYQEVCSGLTGHNEVVRVVFDPNQLGYRELLQVFFESHNPCQGMRQGNDIGTQYRSGIYTYSDSQYDLAHEVRDQYQQLLQAKQPTCGEITTEIMQAPEFYFAEDYHQQYLAKNPNGYCGLGGVGVCFD